MKKRQKCKIESKEHFDIGPGHPMYCCQQWIEGWVNEDAVPISYRPDTRSYYIMCDDRAGWVQRISRCIICNHEFPEYLGRKRAGILDKEYGITDAEEMRHPEKVPEEFKSEEWWRKRGL